MIASMLKKDFLIFQYNDWKLNRERLLIEAPTAGEARGRKQERVQKAAEWMAHYATELRKGYGVEVDAV